MLKLWRLLQGVTAGIIASGVVLGIVAAFFFFALLFRLIGILALVVFVILAVAYVIYDWWTTPAAPKKDP